MKRSEAFAAITLVSFMLVSVVAMAAIATATWTNATKQVDENGVESNIPATGPEALTGTTIEWSVCGTGDVFTTVAGSKTVAPTVTTTQTPDLGPGRWCFRAYHSNSYGPGQMTGIVVKVVAPKQPRPPSNFSVN